jgi:MFS family permease
MARGVDGARALRHARPVPADRSELTGTAVAVVALAFAFNFVARGVADAFAAFVLPLEEAFGWPRRAVTGVFATYMLASGLAAPLAGLAFDRLGPRAVYGGGLALVAGGAWLSSRIDALWQLHLSAGVMVGIGVAALGMTTATALIARWHRRHLSTSIAIAYAGLGSGILVALPLVQALIERHGWRDAWALVGLGTLALLPGCLLLPWRRLAGGPDGRADPHDAAGIASAAGPTLRAALRTPAYWRLVQAISLTAFASFLVTPQTVALLVESGLSPIAAAGAYGTAGLLSTVGVVGTGWACGRLGFGRTARLTFVATAAGLGALLAVSYRASPAALAAYVLCFGIAQGARGPIVSTLTSRHFAGAHVGTIYGTVFCSMAIGGASGAWIGGALHDLTGGYRAVLLLSLLALALGAEAFRPRSSVLRGVDPVRRTGPAGAGPARRAP